MTPQKQKRPRQIRDLRRALPREDLGQQLTGTALLAQVLLDKLEQRNVPETKDARRLADLLHEARRQCHQMARGLPAAAGRPPRLNTVLAELARTVTEAGIACRFRCPSPIRLQDPDKTAHLFRLAQEAIRLAIDHGRCRQIQLQLRARNGFVRLEIRHDGRGWQLPSNRKPDGPALQRLRFRNLAAGGTLETRALRPRGALLACVVPLARRRRR
ncbi:MAG TPA: hypothetical protein VFY06_08155 [Verrucomicrobiae bacterium]|nr:hypothetical protein [Verrucomicrobiae bacterium]